MEKLKLTLLMLGMLFGLSYFAGAATSSSIEIFNLRTDVAVIKLHGEMGMPSGFFYDGGLYADDVEALFEEALSSPMVGAIVIEVNSPGGVASEAELISRAIEKAKKQVPVVSYVPGVAASGGYWVASEADEVFVSPFAMTGSIGVYSQFLNASELYSKIGVEPLTIKSGKYKDLGDPSKGLSAEEKKMMQELSDYVYLKFVDEIAENRNMTRAEILPLAQGQLFIGEQNVENGLADRVGYLEDAIDRAAELANIENPRVVQVEPVPSWEDVFSQMASGFSGFFTRSFGGWTIMAR